MMTGTLGLELERRSETPKLGRDLGPVGESELPKSLRGFHSHGATPNGWFIRENAI